MVDRFETTRWSVVVEAGGEGESARDALSALCRTYHAPVLAYVRARLTRREEAEDLTQAFFAHVLEQNLPARADPARGKFRAFLQTALRNFLANELEWSRAKRRGGDVLFVPDIASETLADGGPGPEQLFEREWARTVVREAMGRLESEIEHAGKAALFAELRPYLIESPAAEDYEAVARSNGMRRGTVAVAVHRMRARLKQLVREVLADTAGNEAEVEEELKHLHGALNRAVG